MSDAPHEHVHLERTVEAPIADVWAKFADPAGFASWYGPDGAAIPTAEWDLAVGQGRRVCMEMTTPNGPMQMWFAGAFTVIEEPTRLEYTEFMANPDGTAETAAEMGMPEGAPMETTVVVSLDDRGATTGLTLTHVGVPAGSPGEGGWIMAVDKLVAHFASA